MKCFYNWFTQNHSKFYLPFKKEQKATFFKPWPVGNQNSCMFKRIVKLTDMFQSLILSKINQRSYQWHDRNLILKVVQCDLNAIQNNAM